jgi:type VI secretion system ImpJ/VasE family protein
MHIHWHEGLFLQPHHFQRMQRGFHEQLQGQHRLIAPYPYGVIEARVAIDALADFRLHFDLLRVLMPSGQEVRVPDNAELPDLHLKPILAGSPGGVTIHLALPVWHDKRANALDVGPQADVRAKLLYRVATEEVADENTGSNAQSMLVRRLNTRLLHEHDDRTDLETVPILRVMLGVGGNVGQSRLDPDYTPPSLFLQSSARLNELVRNLVDQVQASHRELLGQMNRASLSLATMHGQQFEQVLRLRTLSRFASRLPSLLRASSHVTPFQWYLELRELLGELQALKLGQESFEVPSYDHENLYHSFNELSNKVRAILKSAVTSSYAKVEFKKEAEFYGATLTEEQLSRPVDYLIAIETKQDITAVRQLVQDTNRFKFMPRSLAKITVFGAVLEETFPPHFLPNHPGLHYFRVLREKSDKIWPRIKAEKQIGVRWPGFAESDFQLTLYLILPG